MTTLTRPPSSIAWVPDSVSRTSLDVVSVLTLYAAVRIFLPAQYVIGPLGAAGQPALLIALCITLWLLTAWLGRPQSRSHVSQPIKRFAFAFLMAVLVSYVITAMRPANPNEPLGADRALLNVIACLGVMLVAMDGIATRARLDTLLRRLVMLGALEGVFGILQILGKQSFTQYFQLPGLAANGVDDLLIQRGSFLRAAGTAISPIEYGVALSMLLPIALHYAVTDIERRSFLARWFPVAAIALGLSQTISRSAVICSAVGLIMLLIVWPPRLRRRIYLSVPVLIAALAIVRPGFVRTSLNLFTGISDDPSVLSRTNSYAVAWAFITRAPVFGRGMGTFLAEYWILDNQYLGTLIELGAVGLTCMVLLFFSGGVTAWRLREPLAAAGDGVQAASQLGPVLAAAIAAGCVSFAFFDAWSFPWVPSLLFIIFGCVGALRRLMLEDTAGYWSDLASQPLPKPVRQFTIWNLGRTVRRQWPFAAVLSVATLAVAYTAATAPGVYYEEAALALKAPDVSAGENSLSAASPSLVGVAGVLGRQVNEQGPLAYSPDATVLTLNIRNGVWVRLPNDGVQWQPAFEQAQLDIEVSGTTPARVQANMTTTIARAQSILQNDQVTAGASLSQLITSTVSPVSPFYVYVKGSSARAGLAALALGLTFSTLILVLIDRWRRRRAAARGPAPAVSRKLLGAAKRKLPPAITRQARPVATLKKTIGR